MRAERGFRHGHTAGRSRPSTAPSSSRGRSCAGSTAPRPRTRACRMPPASAYWGFFHAPRGGSWTYSSSGVASYSPPAGSVIGFRFGSGQQPRTAPPAPPRPAPKPTTKPTTTPKPTTPKPTTSDDERAAADVAAPPVAPARRRPRLRLGHRPSATARPPRRAGEPPARPRPGRRPHRPGRATLAASPTSATTPAAGGPGPGTLAAGLAPSSSSSPAAPRSSPVAGAAEPLG